MKKPTSVETHEESGRYLNIKPDQKVFVREEGPSDGEVIVMVHGVPSSSFLYRKFFFPLKNHGYRAIAFDFPGIGLSDKPDDADYSWEGLKDSMKLIIDALGVTDITLVIHDIGGPIASWYACENKEKVKRIVMLNTPLKVSVFKKPFPMFIFPIPVFGRIAFHTLHPIIENVRKA